MPDSLCELDRTRKEIGMATYEERLERNVPGEYFVDSTCVDCDQCRATAPEIFFRDDDEGMSFVGRQPTNEDERERTAEALDLCPSESIGKLERGILS